MKRIKRMIAAITLASTLIFGAGSLDHVRADQTVGPQGQQTTTEGVDDKRLMVVESEFASVLSVSDARHRGVVRRRDGDS